MTKKRHDCINFFSTAIFSSSYLSRRDLTEKSMIKMNMSIRFSQYDVLLFKSSHNVKKLGKFHNIFWKNKLNSIKYKIRKHLNNVFVIIFGKSIHYWCRKQILGYFRFDDLILIQIKTKKLSLFAQKGKKWKNSINSIKIMLTLEKYENKLCFIQVMYVLSKRSC